MTHPTNRTTLPMLLSSRIIALILVLLMLIPFSVIPVYGAGKTITSTVSLLNVRQNQSGDGYEWQNRYDTLVLTNLDIDTEDSYGLKICDGAIIELRGNNIIRASEAALYCGGSITVRGSGSLTLISAGSGILVLNTNTEEKLRFINGNLIIEAGKTGIDAPYTQVSLVGDSFRISAKATDGYAIRSRTLNINGGVEITSDNSLYASYRLAVSGAKLDIASSKPALICDGQLTLAQMSLSAGAAADSASACDEYAGESYLKTASTIQRRTPSILFGDKYTIALDIILLCVVVVMFAAVIGVPIVVRKQKYNKLKASLESRNKKAGTK